MRNWVVGLLSVVAAGVLVLLLALSNQGAAPDRGVPDEPIAVVLKSTVQVIDFWDVVWEGIQQASREFGLTVTRHGPPRERDIEEQLVILNEVIDRRPPAIILAAADYHRLAEPVERAADLGIPVITFDSGVSSDRTVSFVATDNVAAGRKAGAEMARLMAEEASARVGGSGEIAIMSHLRETATAIEREEGVRQALADYPIAGTWYCDVDRDLAYRITMELIQRPEITGIVALNETATLGVVDAVVDADAADRVKVVGFDNALQEMVYLEMGALRATVVQHPFDMGYLAVRAAHDYLAGRPVPSRIDTGSLLINADNMFEPGYQETLFPFDAASN